ELRMHGHMATGCGANGPGTAGIVEAGHRGIVLPLTMRLPDGMNGREVEHVKAHARYIGEARCTGLEGAMLAWHRSAGAWKHLIPGAEAGLVAIYHHRELAWVDRSKVAVGVGGHQPEQARVIEDQLRACGTR